METETSTIYEILKTFDLTSTDGMMILVFIPIFVVFWKLLEKAFFSPYFNLIQVREAATVGAEISSQVNNSKAEEFRSQYNQKIIEERVQAMRKKLGLIQEAKAEAARIIDQANQEAQKILKDSRKEIADRLTTLRKSNEAEAQALAQLIAERVKLSTTTVRSGSSGVRQ